ncbi:MAG: MFS transporter [bacterium]
MPQGRIHFINFSRKMTITSTFFLIPLYFLKIGLTGWQIGTVVALFGFAPILFSFPIGWINDRFSINRVIQGAFIAMSLLFFFMRWNRNFYALAPTFLLLGCVNNALDISINSLYYKDDTSIDQNKKYSLLVFWTSLGSASGTLLGGILIFYTSFQSLFIVYALLPLIVLLGTKGFAKETFEAVSFRDYRLSLFNKKTMLFSVLLFILTLHWGAEGTVYSPFLREHFHLNNLYVSLYISIPLFLLAFAAFFIGLLKYNFRTNRRIFLIAMGLSGAGHILMVQTSLYLSFLFRIVHEIGDGFMGALIVLYISRLFEKKNIGGSAGMLTGIMTLGHMVGALVFSPLGFKTGLQYPFLISGFLLIANVFYGYNVFKRTQY